MSKRIIISTICESSWVEKSGLKKMLASCKHFNPDLKILVYDEHELKRLYKNYPPGIDIFGIMAETMIESKKLTGADITVHIDADSLVLCDLKELLSGDYDLWAVRNDPTEHFAPNRDESMNRPYTIRNIPNRLYLNCGFIATSNDDFLNDWANYNRYLINKYGSMHNTNGECPIVEQGSYNLIAYYNNKYKIKLLDPENGDCYCGASANFNNGNNHKPLETIEDYGANHWDSWYSIAESADNSFLNGKRVNILHNCAGGTRKLNFNLFNPEYRKYLTKITGYDR